MALKLGDKVNYSLGNKTGSGVIHAVKKAQDVNDNDVILGYLVDTGEDDFVTEITTEKKKPNVSIRQPVLVEVAPENISPKK